MTEQEKREKAIDEMKFVAEKYCEVIDDAYGCERECIPCSRLFGELYDAGYRKEEEVQKETAKAIRDMLLKRLNEIKNIISRFELAAQITKIETVFGVEVEE